MLCGEPDSINHTYIDCEFPNPLNAKSLISTFDTQNGSNFQPETEETQFRHF